MTTNINYLFKKFRHNVGEEFEHTKNKKVFYNQLIKEVNELEENVKGEF